MSVVTEQENVAPAERHYAVIEVAKMWNLSADKVRDIFDLAKISRFRSNCRTALEQVRRSLKGYDLSSILH